MINLNYCKTESGTMPDETDTASSTTTVYLRKNIRAEQRTDENGRTHTVYVYDEAKIPKPEYHEYLSGKTQADLEYLYMMTGVDYE